jgi:NADH-quinone oxidoreductase subunit L
VVAAASAAPAAAANAWLIPLFPLVGATFIFAFGKRLKRAAGPIATIMLFASFIAGINLFVQLLQSEQRTWVTNLYTFVRAGSFRANVDYRVDPLALVMILVITGVGTLIHLYSVGYMRGDPREPRFFAYLNLFAFSMLVLVLANNFLVMFVGWELVGLCSYLLIGFWFERDDAPAAAKKAFITNRVGDFSFMVGVFLIFAHLGTLDFTRAFAGAGGLSAGTATAIALLLFGGAAGKSAQIPLFVWLPDAMAGPTPVSALIHAATMVTAGVYMVARTHVFFDLGHSAGTVVAWIGVATALVAGVIALAQDDIKRVLAYSTVSQLGYMFIGAGVGAYTAGIFHLVTHAFFKALLFLGAGSVMHAMKGRTDITGFGGLWRKIPWTFVTFAVGWLAIIGFPGTAGFYSKDQVLEGAYNSGQTAIWAAAVAGVFLTGAYMTRLVYLTFFGSKRYEDDVHPHESPVSMVFPLVMLAVASAIGGVLINGSVRAGRLTRWLAPVLGSEQAKVGGSLSATTLSSIALLAGVGGAIFTLALYASGKWRWQERRARPTPLFLAARNRLGIDQLYELLFTGVGKVVASTLAFFVDLKIIDGVVNGVGLLTAKFAASARKVQTGFVRTYALGVLGGGVAVLAFFVLRAAVVK